MKLKIIIITLMLVLTSCSSSASYQGEPWDPENSRTYQMARAQYKVVPECFLVDGLSSGWTIKRFSLGIYCLQE